MSLDSIKGEIKRFLDTDTPEALAIKGAWGVGKTFAWNKYLNEAKKENRIALPHYSYVSLFGINSLDDLKLALFMDLISTKDIGNIDDLTSIESARKKINSLTRKGIKLLNAVPYLKDARSTIESVSFYSLNKVIVCLDDLERKGEGLSAKNIMGLVNLLKEHKQCKVVLIFNDESLQDKLLIDYRTFREKVIDIELVFDPSPSECSKIALVDDLLSRKLAPFTERLGINNIRIIKKIERLAKIMADHLKGLEEEVFDQAFHSLTLLAWCFYSEGKGVPKYEQVIKRGYGEGFLRMWGKGKEPSEVDKELDAVLTKYDFLGCRAFDLEIAKVVENGYVHESLREEATKLNQEIHESKAKTSIVKAWDIFRDSFDDNEKDLVDALVRALSENSKYVSVPELEGVVRFLRELGKNELADKMIDLFVEKRRNEKQLFSLQEQPFGDLVKDPKLIEAFNKVSEGHKEKRTLREVLHKISEKDGWGPDDEAVLAQATPEDYYTIFKSEKGSSLAPFVHICLKFGRLLRPSEPGKRISENATAALKMIAQENHLNEIRVRSLGIKLKPKDEGQK